MRHQERAKEPLYSYPLPLPSLAISKSFCFLCAVSRAQKELVHSINPPLILYHHFPGSLNKKNCFLTDYEPALRKQNKSCHSHSSAFVLMIRGKGEGETEGEGWRGGETPSPTREGTPASRLARAGRSSELPDLALESKFRTDL